MCLELDLDMLTRELVAHCATLFRGGELCERRKERSICDRFHSLIGGTSSVDTVQYLLVTLQARLTSFLKSFAAQVILEHPSMPHCDGLGRLCFLVEGLLIPEVERMFNLNQMQQIANMKERLDHSLRATCRQLIVDHGDAIVREANIAMLSDTISPAKPIIRLLRAIQHDRSQLTARLCEATKIVTTTWEASWNTMTFAYFAKEARILAIWRARKHLFVSHCFQLAGANLDALSLMEIFRQLYPDTSRMHMEEVISVIFRDGGDAHAPAPCLEFASRVKRRRLRTAPRLQEKD